MKLLLDTHTFLWFALNDNQLSATAMSLIGNLENDVLLSPASCWEIAIKISIGKYQVPGDFQSWMEQQISVNSFEILPIRLAHVSQVATLPFHYKDPFDRLLVAQALVEDISIISGDKKMDQYSVKREW